MLKIVLDTNIILSSVSPYSKYRIIFDKLDDFEYELCVSTEILMEYAEKLTEFFNPTVAQLTLDMMMINPNVSRHAPSFQTRLIYYDYDDNKFVDCAFTANAHFLVTEDRHFKVVKQSPFPKINVIGIDEFVEVLQHL
jgi:uncharacterized protein